MSINPAKWGQCINILIHTGKFQYDDIYTEAFTTECKRLYDYLIDVESKMREEAVESNLQAALDKAKTRKDKVFQL